MQVREVSLEMEDMDGMHLDEKAQRVCGEEEREKREKDEDRRGIRYFVHGLWGNRLCRILVLCSMQMNEYNTTVTSKPQYYSTRSLP